MLDTVGVGFLAPMPNMHGELPGDPTAAWRLMLSGPDQDSAQPARAVLNGSKVQLTWHAKPPISLTNQADEGTGFLVARASLPKVRYGSNYKELQWEEAEAAFQQLVEQAAAAAGLSIPPAEEVYLNRVDLTRNQQQGSDAAVEAQIRKLADAGALLIPGRWKFTFHRSRQLHGALTVVWQQKDRSLMVYDKHKESREPEAAGLCRYEVRHQGRGVVRHLGLRRLSDLSVPRLLGQLEDYLRQVPALAEEETLQDRVLRACGDLYGLRKGPARAMRLLAYIEGSKRGVWEAMPPSTARRYKNEIRKLAAVGVTVADDV